MDNIISEEKIISVYNKITEKIKVLEKDLAKKLWGEPDNKDK